MSSLNNQIIRDIEFRSFEEIANYQEALLKNQIEFVMRNSKYYSKLCLKHSSPNLNEIPFTEKSHLSENNDSFLAVKRGEVAEICMTSGSTGNQVSIYLSKKDLNRLALNEKVTFERMGIGKGDIVQLMLTLDKQFMAGIAYYSGLLETDATILRIGPSSPEIQLLSLIKNNVTCLIAIPSAILKLINYAHEISFDLSSLALKKILCIGEPIYTKDLKFNLLSSKILQSLPVELFSTYASSEMQTAFTDCSSHHGLHINPSLIYVEVVDENGNQVKNREIGEVVVSPLGVEAMPLLRYKTEDICEFILEPCPCGRNTIRLGPVLGRKNQMLKLNGTTIFPTAIIQILNTDKSIEDFVIIATKDSFGLDNLHIHLKQTVSDLQYLAIIEKKLQSMLRVSISISTITEADINKIRGGLNSSKSIKFIDRRN